MTVQDFKSISPTLTLEDYFQGKTRAYGLFEDRFGKVRNQFTVQIEGTWDGETLVLDEDFLYSDGETECRRWELKKQGNSGYIGYTDSVVGAAKGEVVANSFNWRYTFNLKVGDNFWKVKFDDWMFLQPDGVLLNKATVTRWGVKLGTVFISFAKDIPDLAKNP
ncbi:DUF3833 domain-containing protein [Kordiimonas sp. SCSIO 12610]|uniref:DUF3833 domain-containing protein n=1 Tax=Kordiimonas sp. SCSIO 12610 TaxID=2829597 RepID=UPI00210A99FD|nr:DUF3833 domain-containing protein [Kordiimonas sp. SCSIO 12610]UTW54354.1 DUF3833 domain-containing protein [Kordiimonas sp. SCSIO 12610]